LVALLKLLVLVNSPSCIGLANDRIRKRILLLLLSLALVWQAICVAVPVRRKTAAMSRIVNAFAAALVWKLA